MYIFAIAFLNTVVLARISLWTGPH